MGKKQLRIYLPSAEWYYARNTMVDKIIRVCICFCIYMCRVKVFWFIWKEKLIFAFELHSETYHLDMNSKVWCSVYKTSIPFGSGVGGKMYFPSSILSEFLTFIKYSQFYYDPMLKGSYLLSFSFFIPGTLCICARPSQRWRRHNSTRTSSRNTVMPRSVLLDTEPLQLSPPLGNNIFPDLSRSLGKKDDPGRTMLEIQ